MQVYSRYLFNHLLSYFLSIVLVFELVITANLLARLLDKIAEGSYPVSVLMPFLTFAILKSLVFIIPLSAMLAIILSFSQKYQEGEIYVAFSLGIYYRRLLYTTARLWIPLLVLSSVLVTDILPISRLNYEQLKITVRETMDINTVTPGEFISLGKNKIVFAGSYDREKSRLENIFTALRTDDQLIIETARYGIQKQEAGEKRLYLHNGNRYQGIPNETSFQVSQFDLHWIVLPSVAPEFTLDDPEMLRFSELLSSQRTADKAEIQMRLAMPVALILLSLMALLLSQIQPRRERYIRITMGIIISLLYLNAIALVGEFITNGHSPLFPGVWGVHGLMIALLITLSVNQRLLSNPFLRKEHS